MYSKDHVNINEYETLFSETETSENERRLHNRSTSEDIYKKQFIEEPNFNYLNIHLDPLSCLLNNYVFSLYLKDLAGMTFNVYFIIPAMQFNVKHGYFFLTMQPSH